MSSFAPGTSPEEMARVNELIYGRQGLGFGTPFGAGPTILDITDAKVPASWRPQARTSDSTDASFGNWLQNTMSPRTSMPIVGQSQTPARTLENDPGYSTGLEELMKVMPRFNPDAPDSADAPVGWRDDPRYKFSDSTGASDGGSRPSLTSRDIFPDSTFVPSFGTPFGAGPTFSDSTDAPVGWRPQARTPFTGLPPAISNTTSTADRRRASSMNELLYGQQGLGFDTPFTGTVPAISNTTSATNQSAPAIGSPPIQGPMSDYYKAKFAPGGEYEFAPNRNNLYAMLVENRFGNPATTVTAQGPGWDANFEKSYGRAPTDADRTFSAANDMAAGRASAINASSINWDDPSKNSANVEGWLGSLRENPNFWGATEAERENNKRYDPSGLTFVRHHMDAGVEQPDMLMIGQPGYRNPFAEAAAREANFSPMLSNAELDARGMQSFDRTPRYNAPVMPTFRPDPESVRMQNLQLANESRAAADAASMAANRQDGANVAARAAAARAFYNNRSPDSGLGFGGSGQGTPGQGSGSQAPDFQSMFNKFSEQQLRSQQDYQKSMTDQWGKQQEQQQKMLQDWSQMAGFNKPTFGPGSGAFGNFGGNTSPVYRPDDQSSAPRNGWGGGPWGASNPWTPTF